MHFSVLKELRVLWILTCRITFYILFNISRKSCLYDIRYLVLPISKILLEQTVVDIILKQIRLTCLSWYLDCKSRISCQQALFSMFAYFLTSDKDLKDSIEENPDTLTVPDWNITWWVYIYVHDDLSLIICFKHLKPGGEICLV